MRIFILKLCESESKLSHVTQINRAQMPPKLTHTVSTYTANDPSRLINYTLNEGS